MFIEQKQLNDFIMDSGLVTRAEFDTAALEAEKKRVP